MPVAASAVAMKSGKVYLCSPPGPSMALARQELLSTAELAKCEELGVCLPGY